MCDVGVNADLHCPAVLDRKIVYGTRNLAVEPAMTRAETEKAILTGAELKAVIEDLDKACARFPERKA